MARDGDKIIVLRTRRPRIPSPPRDADRSAPAPEMNIVAQAVVVLGDRIGSLRGVRLLDGSPCDLDRLMTEANKYLAAAHLPQLGRKPEWRA